MNIQELLLLQYMKKSTLDFEKRLLYSIVYVRFSSSNNLTNIRIPDVGLTFNRRKLSVRMLLVRFFALVKNQPQFCKLRRKDQTRSEELLFLKLVKRSCLMPRMTYLPLFGRVVDSQDAPKKFANFLNGWKRTLYLKEQDPKRDFLLT